MRRKKNEAGETTAFVANSIEDFLTNKAAVSSKEGRLTKVFIFEDVDYNIIDNTDGEHIVSISSRKEGFHEPLIAYAVNHPIVLSNVYGEKDLPKNGQYSVLTLMYKNTLRFPYVHRVE